ncbi:MAG: hypothetical protein AAGE94_26170 [Acidobacteriota bacterium]
MSTRLFRLAFVVTLTLAASAAVLWPATSVEATGASLVCESTGNGAICEAFPQGADYGYAWTRTGNLLLTAAPPSSPVRQVQCWGSGNGGSVHVVVTFPDGSQTTVSRSVECGGLPF